MKNWYFLNSENILLGVFLLLITVIGHTFYSERIDVLRLVLVLAIPLFVITYFFNRKYLNLAIFCFLIFAFLSSVFNSYFIEVKQLKISNILNFAGILSLNYIAFQKFNELKLRKWLKVYVAAMFLIGLTFWLEINSKFKSFIYVDFEFYLFAMQGLGLLVLVLMAFLVCLITPEKKTESAIPFFIGVVCFAFASGVYYISNYYVYNWIFEPISQLFYVSGIYFMFKYMLAETRDKKSIKDCNVVFSEIAFS